MKRAGNEPTLDEMARDVVKAIQVGLSALERRLKIAGVNLTAFIAVGVSDDPRSVVWEVQTNVTRKGWNQIVSLANDAIPPDDPLVDAGTKTH